MPLEYTKFTQFNLDLIKNLPSDMINELIFLEDVIPDGIGSTIAFHDEFFKKGRGDFINYRPDILSKMYKARALRKERAETEGIINTRTDENVNFIKKYPQFKRLIDSIAFENNDSEVIKVVLIDEYLSDEAKIFINTFKINESVIK